MRLAFPMLPEGVSPNPPIKPAHMSERISPYRLGMTMTRSPNGLGFCVIFYSIRKSCNKSQPCRTMHITHLEANPIEQIFIIRYVRKFLRDFAARGQEHAIRHFPDQIKSAINDVMACE